MSAIDRVHATDRGAAGGSPHDTFRALLFGKFVRDFLTDHPSGTVVEFEPSSVDAVGKMPGPYLFLIEDGSSADPAALAREFPGSRVAFGAAAGERPGLRIVESYGPGKLPGRAFRGMPSRERRALASAHAAWREQSPHGDYRFALAQTSRTPVDWRTWSASTALFTPDTGDADLQYCELPAATPDYDPVPVIMLHGFAGSTADWDGVAPALAADRRVIAYDHRGHGGSTKYADHAAYTFDTLTSDFAAFAVRVAPGPVDLIGHSIGGVVALRHALAHPERVRSLVLVSTAARPSANPVLRALFRTLTAIVNTWGMSPLIRLARRTVRIQDGTPESEAARLQRQGAALESMDPQAFVAFGKAILDYPSLAPRLAELTCPTTVVTGIQDTGLRPAARQFVTTAPSARAIVIPDAGHSPQTEAPEAWLAAVREHFAQSTVRSWRPPVTS